jgi:hypothetical protein
VDGESFDLCDSFDDLDAGALTDEWGSTEVSNLSHLDRTSTTFASAPRALLSQTPALDPHGAVPARARVVMANPGPISRVIVDYRARLDEPNPSPNAFFLALGDVVFHTASDFVGLSVVAAQNVGESLSYVSEAANQLAEKPTISTAWSDKPAFSTWRHIRRELTLDSAQNKIHEIVLLDGASVLDWSVPIPPGPIVGVSVALGLFISAAPSSSWTAYYDDVRIALRQ